MGRGKDLYRAPEVYMPAGALQIQAQCPEGCTPGHVVQVAGGGFLCNVRFPPEAVPGQVAVAQMYGYAAAPVDVFACGVVFFILHAQAPPFPLASLSNKSFAYVCRHGAAKLLQGWKKPLPPLAEELCVGMMQPYPATRWKVERATTCEWFADIIDRQDSSSPGPSGANAASESTSANSDANRL